MGERPSEFARDANDWYVEPKWCIDAILTRYRLPLGLHDPCCGIGTIPTHALAQGIAATGADLIDRAEGRFPVADYLADWQTHPAIVTNPPFKIAHKIVRHALDTTAHGGIVAIIAQAKFLFSQGRREMFNTPEMDRVICFSRRPSMPPGELLAEKGEACRGGGSIDFVWCVWRVGKTSPGSTVEWTL